jgi:ketosteroid isomerase-like protein
MADGRRVAHFLIPITSGVIAAIPPRREIGGGAEIGVRFDRQSTPGGTTMSAQEDIRRVVERIATASAKGDFAPFIAALDDDVEVFDHVAYRFERKGEFLDYLGSVMGGESTTFAFHQPSCRVFNDDAAIVNAYDRLAMTPKGGGAPQVACGRTTLVFVKKGADWKIVGAHFSPLPKE